MGEQYQKQLRMMQAHRRVIEPPCSDCGHPHNLADTWSRGRALTLGCLLFLTANFTSGCIPIASQFNDNPLNDVLRTTAMSAETGNDYRRAIRHFKTLNARDPNNPEVLQSLARNLRYGGEAKEAVGLLGKSMGKLGRKPTLVLELAKAQLAASMMDEAHLSLVEARHLLPNDWQVHSAWGVYSDRVGNFSEAKQHYEVALELSPDNFAVLNNLALSQALAGNIEEGITTLRKLVDGKNSTSLVRQNLALLYGIKGDLEAAKRLAQKDLPKDAVAKNLSTFRDFHE